MAIVVGYTDRPESRVALARAIQEARLRGASLHIVQALQEPPGEDPGHVRRWSDRIDHARAEGSELEGKLRQDGVDAHFNLLLLSPEPAAKQLLRVANDVNADLIVIGLRRRSPVGKLVLGSVSQELLLEANCAVLAVKAPD
jgi:nucleotide-binding universal stress UspA family protein